MKFKWECDNCGLEGTVHVASAGTSFVKIFSEIEVQHAIELTECGIIDTCDIEDLIIRRKRRE